MNSWQFFQSNHENQQKTYFSRKMVISVGPNKYKLQLKMSRQSWSNEEDETISLLVQEWGIDDWTKIAIKMKDHLGGKQSRTGKQCRERWHNHLNPSVSKHPWSEQQEQQLFSCHRDYGNHWKDISRQFSGRTDNDIKNHFYSTLRRSLRRLNKIVGQKNSTTQMREIKPSVLSTIMHFIYEQQVQRCALLQSLRDLPTLIFQFAKYKPVKLNIHNGNIELIRQKTNQIFNLITRFNNQYQLNKANRKLPKPIITDTNQNKKNILKDLELSEEDKYSQLDSQNQQHQSQPDSQKPMDKTQFTLHHSVDQDYNHEQMTLLPIHIHMTGSPKSEGKDVIQSYHHRTFSLQADEIDDMQFNEPEQPSHMHMVVHQELGLNDNIEEEKSGSNGAELIDQVVNSHFCQ